MAFIKDNKIYDFDRNNIPQPFGSVLRAINISEHDGVSMPNYDDYVEAIRSPISKKITRVYLLNKDETINRDISEYVVESNVDQTHQSGQVATASISITNFENEWKPDPVKGTIWKNTKLRIDIGIVSENGNVYWKQFGIFVVGDISVNVDNMTLSFQCYDKYALLDGTLGGKNDSYLYIPVGTNIRQAIYMCLRCEKTNGEYYDEKPILFPPEYEEVVTPYTIQKDTNYAMGEVIDELAKMVFCDVNYNAYGNLQLIPSSDYSNENLESKAIQWNYTEDDNLYISSSINMQLSQVVNRITVYGAIENGHQYKGTAENKNFNSLTNVYVMDANSELVEDSNIFGDENCLNRAEYELKKKSLLSMGLTCESLFIPHLNINDIVIWRNENYPNSNKFLITSISMNLSNSALMSITMTNISEVML